MDYVIFALAGDYSKIAEEIEKELKKEEEEDGFVSIHSFDMLSQSYAEKCEECEALKTENKKLIAELNKYRYFIECQKNEIEKL